MREEYLRIPDNVDLKELEKFGGKLETSNENYSCYWYTGYNERIWVNYKRNLIFEIEDEVYDYVISDKTMCLLFDLIQAGLVEKVVEDE